MNNTTNLSRREALAKASALGAGAALMLATKAGHAQTRKNAAGAEMQVGTPAETEMEMDAAAPKMSAPAGDLDIVRFALTMERLEAAFYAQVLTAHGERAYLSPRAFELTRQIALAEADHVQALEGVLSAAEQPLPGETTYQFPAAVFVSPITFAWFAYTLEEIGIGAYLGAVGAIQSDAIRGAAASIYGAEAQHAALLRTFAGFDFAPKYYETPLSVAQVTELITPYIVA